MANVGAAFSIDTTDLMHFSRIREQGPRIVQKNMLLGMEGGVNVLFGDVKELTPKCRSGKLQASLQKSIMQNARGVTGTVKSLGSIAPHNRWVHDGRGPVVARKAKALRLQLCSGAVLFRKSVKASRPNPFMDKGRNKAETKVYRSFDEAVARIVAELGT